MLKLAGPSDERAVAVTMRSLALGALAALALAVSAANDDYVALRALYESTGGSGWTHNANWDMSNTSVCGWNEGSSLFFRVTHHRRRPERRQRVLQPAVLRE